MMSNFNRFNLFISGVCVMTLFLFTARPVYSIPKKIEELCGKFNMTFCAGEKKTEAQQKIEKDDEEAKLQNFTQSEKEVLTRLLEQQKQMQLKEGLLNQREAQLKALQEDIQNQIVQLELVQQKIGKDIETKKILDNEQFNKAVALYDKMEAPKAALSIAELEAKTAIKILMKLKDKKASEILANMKPSKAAELIQGMTLKK
ncbi:hypothetical protein WDW89_00310 [Deltaproteobacteria bacterium TL4]